MALLIKMATLARGRILAPSVGALLLLAAVAAAEVRVGDRAPVFTLPDGTGKPIALESLGGKIVILDFTASWCVACRTALPALATLAARYADRDVVLLAIDIDTSRASADRFLDELVPTRTMTVVYDPKAAVLARYGAGGMPALYLVDRTRVVRLVESGYGAERLAAVGDAIETLLAGDAKPPVTP